MSSKRIVRLYFAATAVFLALDFLAGVTLRRPASADVVGAFESVVALAALIVTFGVRVMAGSARALDDAAALVTVSEVINFVLAGGIAYVGWISFSASLRERK